jgi:hypothetical protein
MAMQTEPHLSNGVTETMDMNDHHNNSVTNIAVPVSVSASAMEHQATVAMTLGYDKMYDSIYNSVGYCHFF